MIDLAPAWLDLAMGVSEQFLDLGSAFDRDSFDPRFADPRLE
jgi:hypothetical protein